MKNPGLAVAPVLLLGVGVLVLFLGADLQIVQSCSRYAHLSYKLTSVLQGQHDDKLAELSCLQYHWSNWVDCKASYSSQHNKGVPYCIARQASH